MDLSVTVEIISSISVILASTIAILGISSWRNEAEWKRKFELAEDVLANAYDAQFRFRIIRQSISYTDEGKTRQIDESENPKHSHTLRLGYIIYERFNNEKEPFIQLEKLVFRFMALMGKEKAKPLLDIINVKNEILHNADLFVKFRIWYRDEIDNGSTDKDQLTFYNNTAAEASRVIWERSNEIDNINVRIGIAIKELEEICKPIIEGSKKKYLIF